jgi:hydrophobe/amphiphile efflux-1 (HAE1) family protein
MKTPKPVDALSFFIKRHVFTWMIMAALIFFGAVSYTRVGVSEFPDVDFPVVNIQVRWEGASPELMEVQIVTAIEDAVSSVEGITKIYATARNQQASITVEFDLDKNIDAAVQEVQSAIARAQRLLPREIDPPIVSKSNPEDRPIMWLTVTSKTHSREDLMRLVRDKIRPQFSMVTGVAEVMLGGFSTPTVLVRPHTDKLKALDFTVSDIVNTFAQEHIELPSGRLESPTAEWGLRTFGEAQSLEELRQLPIIRRGGAPNYKPTQLGDVADIEVGLENTRFRARAMGESAIGLGFKKQRGSNAVAVGDAVLEKMALIQAQFKTDDIQIGVNFDSTAYIKDAIHEMLFTLIFAAILTSLVCWLFLGQFGITINVILAIPTAIIGTFSVLHMMGFTMNTFTLLALSLAIGIVVDDAIMVLENIMRHLKMGKTPFEAAHEGTKEIFFAVMATTTVLLAIFLPVVYLQGIIGAYMLQFGITLCAAVALSCVEALTLTPMRCAGLLTQHQAEQHTWMDRFMGWTENRYQRLLALALSWRISTLVLTAAIMALMAWASVGIRQEFMPYQDTNRIVLMLRAPLGISIAIMDEKFKAVEKILAQEPDMARYFGSIGGGDTNTGRVFVQLKNKEDRSKDKNGDPRGQREIADALRTKLKDLKGVMVLVQDNSNRAFMDRTGYPIEVSIRGTDWATLSKAAKGVQTHMKTLPNLVDVETDYRTGLPELHIIPNRIAAEKHGVSVIDINKTIQTMMGGSIAGKYTLEGYRYDIRVWLAPEARAHKDQILALQVRNNRGENVPISKLVTLKETKTLQAINRENKERAITLTANLAENASQADAIKSIDAFAKKTLPQGYHAVFSGTTAAFSDTFEQLMLALGLGVVAAYMILAAQFNSFLRPMVILTAVPFSIIGALIVLKWGGQSLNLFSMIGLILVVGLALKNAIILVDFTVQREREGEPQEMALLTACPLRLRPIFMTTLATIAGALPAAIAFGPGAESRIPMALAVIGGISIAMVFSLIVVPVLYSLVIPRLNRG